MLKCNIRSRCHSVLMLFALLLSVVVVHAASAQTIRLHVDGTTTLGTPTNPNPGETWSNPYKYLSAAIAQANALLSGFTPPAKVDIWVRGATVSGVTYRPDESAANPTGSGSRTATFTLRQYVSIYGGFAGTESSSQFNLRSPATNITILSGDLGTVDAFVAGSSGHTYGNYSDNSHHVVASSVFLGANPGTPAAPHLDGFTVRGGNADGGSNANGAGIWVYQGNPTIRNCIIEQNTTTNTAGGFYLEDGNGHPILRDCTLRHNTAGAGNPLSFARGGGFSSENAEPYSDKWDECVNGCIELLP